MIKINVNIYKKVILKGKDSSLLFILGKTFKRIDKYNNKQ